MDKYKGQFFTPKETALEMFRRSVPYLKEQNLNILDPCVGHGSLIKPFLNKFNKSKYICFDIEKGFLEKSKKYLKKEVKNYKLYNEDYILNQSYNNKIDFVIINPPYVRQEWIEKSKKDKYKAICIDYFKQNISSQSNLMVYFVLKAIIDLKSNGLGCIIVYDILENSRYGKDFFEIFYKHCEVVDQYKLKTPFDDVLIDAKVYIFRKKEKLSFNFIVDNFNNNNKYIELKNLFNIKRGLGLKSKKTFTFNQDSESIFLKYTKDFILNAKSIDNSTHKITTHKAFIFEEEIGIPTELKEYLKNKYLNLHNKNLNTVTHKEKKSQILFNYFFRERPYFYENKKLYNASDNFFLLDFENLKSKTLVKLLNSDLYINPIIDCSRSLGSGLNKIQLYEFKNVKVPNWLILDNKEKKVFFKKLDLSENDKSTINKIVREFILDKQ